MADETKAIYDPARTEPYAPAEVCEAVKVARMEGVGRCLPFVRDMDPSWPGTLALNAETATLYPAPFVERPRVLDLPVDGTRFRFRVVNGVAEWASTTVENWTPFWRDCGKGRIEPCATLLAGLADLLTTPTERVSAEVGQ